MWTFFLVVLFTTLIVINRKAVGEFCSNPKLWFKTLKYRLMAWRAGRWTTYFHKTVNGCYVHLVPEHDMREHITDDDGKCSCHTKKEEVDNTVVYQHHRIGM